MIHNLATNSLIEILTALAAVNIIMLLWKFRNLLEVKFLIYLEVFAGIWALTYAFEFASTELVTKIFWSKMSYLGIAFLPVCYFLFTTAFSQKSNIINLRKIAFLTIIPLITLGLVFTNESHHLVWSDVTLDKANNMAHYHHGVWF